VGYAVLEHPVLSTDSISALKVPHPSLQLTGPAGRSTICSHRLSKSSFLIVRNATPLRRRSLTLLRYRDFGRLYVKSMFWRGLMKTSIPGRFRRISRRHFMGTMQQFFCATDGQLNRLASATLAASHLGDDSAAANDFDQTVRLRIEKLDRIIRQHPDDAPAYVQRGFARVEYRDLQGAIDDYSQAIRLDPRNVDAYYYRGKVYCKQGRKQAALKEYDEALRIDPNRTDVYVTRAALRLELGDREGAAEDFGRARRINPDDQVPQSRPK